MNDNSELNSIKEQLNMTLRLLGLNKLNPIFAYPSIKEWEDKRVISVEFPDFVRYKGPQYDFSNVVLPADYEREPQNWHILTKEKIIIKECSTLPGPVKIYLCKDPSIPVYVRLFDDLAQRLLKNSLITINDGLPHYLTATIRQSYNYKRNKGTDLRFIAESLFRGDRDADVCKGKVEAFLMKNKAVPFRRAIDELLNLTGKQINSELSYCLACGYQLEKGKKFCNSTQEGHLKSKFKDNCRNKFNGWLKRRLDMGDSDERARAREKLYRELQEIISIYPAYAFNIFKKKHPKLYTPGYKERWKRERLKKELVGRRRH